MIPFFLLFTFSASAKKYHAVLDGNWHVPSTWDLYEVPSSADTVIIDGYTVTFDINASTDSISRVEIYNVSNANNSKLRIADASTLTVLNDLVLISYNNQKDIELKIEDFATLNIFGNVYFERTAENIESGKLSFFMLDDSRMNVIGDFNYDYKNASETEEGGFEVRLDNNSVFSVAGNTSFTIANGKEFFIELKDDASALLYGDMIMEMTGGKNFLVKTSATSTFNVQGNATLKNSGQNSSLVFGSFSNDGNFNVEGNFDIISTVANSPLTLQLIWIQQVLLLSMVKIHNLFQLQIYLIVEQIHSSFLTSISIILLANQWHLKDQWLSMIKSFCQMEISKQLLLEY